MTPPKQADSLLRRLGFGLLRVLGFFAGLIAAAIAIPLPLLFLSNELQEADSAPQWGMKPLDIVVGRVVSVVVAFGFAALAGFTAYRLLRFTFKGPRAH
jgi:hypothetical protein